MGAELMEMTENAGPPSDDILPCLACPWPLLVWPCPLVVAVEVVEGSGAACRWVGEGDGSDGLGWVEGKGGRRTFVNG